MVEETNHQGPIFFFFARSAKKLFMASAEKMRQQAQKKFSEMFKYGAKLHAHFKVVDRHS